VIRGSLECWKGTLRATGGDQGQLGVLDGMAGEA